MKQEGTMLKIQNVSKIYRLGEIGGTTLRDELQRAWAKLRKKEDPTKKIGTKNYNKGEKFKALNSVSFEVKQGERIGIIGHNGAGKSTLLKLISRVTGPTEGKIYLNGRVASMLEVGTGFHPELTGRENIYMNGAILGMTKKEIDDKIEDIIEFSEVRQFIDTPVKRYSSGMYVKLAFSVAAHLDSEIMIMDEVLAVGDINFQQKCISKMKQISIDSRRTILYVSHNMKTIRELCDRVIVLNHGSIIFDGDVEKGIAIYSKKDLSVGDEFKDNQRVPDLPHRIILKKMINVSVIDDCLSYDVELESSIEYSSAVFRIVFFSDRNSPVCTSYSSTFNISQGKGIVTLSTKLSMFVNGVFSVDLILSTVENGQLVRQDVVRDAFLFEKNTKENQFGVPWRNGSWGCIDCGETDIRGIQNE